MSTVTERPSKKPSKTLDSKQRNWLQKMGTALGASVKSKDADEPAPTGNFPEIMWEKKRDVVEETAGLVKEMEDAQLSKAPLYRKGLNLIRGLAKQKKYAEANKAYDQLHSKIHTEYDKFQQARGNRKYAMDVEDDEADKKSAQQEKYATGLEIREPDKEPAKQERYATGLEIPGSGPGESQGKYAEQGPYGPAAPPQAPTAPSAPPAPTDPNSAQYQKQICKVGSKGPAVEYLQKMLQGAGWSIGVDGKYGPGTQKAVKEYQASKGLKPDGIVGANTWTALAGGSGYPPTQPGHPGGYAPSPPGGPGYPPAKPGQPGYSPLPPGGSGYAPPPPSKPGYPPPGQPGYPPPGQPGYPPTGGPGYPPPGGPGYPPPGGPGYPPGKPGYYPPKPGHPECPPGAPGYPPPPDPYVPPKVLVDPVEKSLAEQLIDKAKEAKKRIESILD